MFRSLIFRLVLNAGTLYLLTYLLPTDVTYTGGVKFFVVAGLFMIFINAFLLWLLKYSLDIIKFQDVSLVIHTKGGYLIAGLLFGLLNWILNVMFRK